MTAPTQPIASFCSHCGYSLQPDAKFCPKCGGVLSFSSPQPNASPLFVTTTSGSDQIAALEHMVSEHPGDESYQKLLALQLHDDAIKDWWKDPRDGSYLCTAWRQIRHARTQLDRAEALALNDPQLRAELAKTRKLVNGMEQRQYTGNWFQVIILGFFYIFPGWIWWYVNRRPTFLLNRDYVKYSETGKHQGVGAKMGGAMEKVSNFFDSITGGWGGFFALAFMIVFSPVFMILAYKQNYVDVKKEYDMV